MTKFDTKTLSGFPEFSPVEENLRQSWVKIIADSFAEFGFISIQTPLVERKENLLGKGGNPKEIYALKRAQDDINDTGSSGKALRFDQTVPLALYVARHQNSIVFPFRRSVIGPVFRGERPQKGRFRQFDQCDIDIIGSGNLSLKNDAQIPAIIVQIFQRLGLGDFQVRINNRKILTGFFSGLGLVGGQHKLILDIVDDLEKLSVEKIDQAFKSAGLKAEQIEKIKQLVGTNHDQLDSLKTLSDNLDFQRGIQELQTVLISLQAMGVEKKYYRVDLSIARGLDYYTGTIYETTLVDHPEFGSVCSGGRYDDLAAIFTGKKYPGVGMSIGLTRLFSQALKEGLIRPKRVSPTQVLLVAADEMGLVRLLSLGTKLREDGFRVENYLETKKLTKQFDYAHKLGIPFVAVMGKDEIVKNLVVLKDMQSGEEKILSQSDLGTYLNTQFSEEKMER